MESICTTNANSLALILAGQGTTDIITNTAARVPSGGEPYFRKITALTNAAFTALLQANTYINGTLTADLTSTYGTLAAGSSLEGKFSSITLASGSVIAKS